MNVRAVFVFIFLTTFSISVFNCTKKDNPPKKKEIKGASVAAKTKIEEKKVEEEKQIQPSLENKAESPAKLPGEVVNKYEEEAVAEVEAEIKLPYREMPALPDLEVKAAGVKVNEILKRAQMKEDYTQELNEMDALGYPAFPELKKIVTNATEKWGKRWIAMMAIGRMRTLESRKFLIENLKNSVSTVRMSSVIALKNYPDDEVINHIHEVFLNDSSMFVRNTATDVLAQIRDPRSIDILSQGLANDKNRYRGRNLWIRNNIVSALGKFKSKKAAPYLVRVLEDNDRVLFTDTLKSLEYIFSEDLDVLLIKNADTDKKVTYWLNWWEKNKKDYL